MPTAEQIAAFRAKLEKQNRPKTIADLKKEPWIKALPSYSSKLPAEAIRSLMAKHHHQELQKKFRQGNLVTTIIPDQIAQTNILSFLTRGQTSAYSKISKKAHELVGV